MRPMQISNFKSQNAVRVVRDPPLPANRRWLQATPRGRLGFYLAVPAMMDFSRNWNLGRLLRYDTRKEAQHECNRLGLNGHAVIEEIKNCWDWKPAKRKTRKKIQFLIRRVFR